MMMNMVSYLNVVLEPCNDLEDQLNSASCMCHDLMCALTMIADLCNIDGEWRTELDPTMLRGLVQTWATLAQVIGMKVDNSQKLAMNLMKGRVSA